MEVNQGGTGGLEGATSTGVSTADLNAALARFMTRAEAQSAIANMEGEIAGKASKGDIPAAPDLSQYAKKTDIPAASDMSSYAKKSDIPAAVDLSGYVTTAALGQALSSAGVTATQMNATLGADGSAIIKFSDFSKIYASAPLVIPAARFVANRGYWAVPGAVTAAQVTVTGRRSKGTLLLSDGPNEAATSGDVVSVVVIGK